MRVLCQDCKKKKQVAASELRKNFPAEYIQEDLGKGAKVTVWDAQGCPICQNIGYADRIGIHEVLLVDDDIRRAIIERKAADTIQGMSVEKGMVTMLADGFLKVAGGITTIEEMLRVVKE